MNNLIKKILYCLLSIQEKALTYRLDKTLKHSHSNRTSKNIISSTEHMTLSVETQKNADLVKKNVEDILSSVKNNTDKLLEYIKAAGCKVYRIPHADKILKALNEEEGFIPELRGLKAIYLNFILNKKFSIHTEPLFLLGDGDIDFIALLHSFYRWYSYKAGLPGFDYKSQQYFKVYIRDVNADLSKLSVEDILNLQEAVARDKEATAFCLEYSKNTKGAENAHKKLIEEGGTNI